MSTKKTSSLLTPELERFRNNPALVATFNRRLTPWDATFSHRLAKYGMSTGQRPRTLYVGDREWAWFEAAGVDSFRLTKDGHKGAHGEYRGVRIIRCHLKKHWHFTA